MFAHTQAILSLARRQPACCKACTWERTPEFVNQSSSLSLCAFLSVLLFYHFTFSFSITLSPVYLFVFLLLSEFVNSSFTMLDLFLSLPASLVPLYRCLSSFTRVLSCIDQFLTFLQHKKCPFDTEHISLYQLFVLCLVIISFKVVSHLFYRSCPAFCCFLKCRRAEKHHRFFFVVVRLAI